MQKLTAPDAHAALMTEILEKIAVLKDRAENHSIIPPTASTGATSETWRAYRQCWIARLGIQRRMMNERATVRFFRTVEGSA